MNKRICSVVLALGLVVSGVVAGPATAAKKKKKPKPAACAPYTPGELGAEADTVVVTDAHTAEAPLTYAFSLDANVDEGLRDIIGVEQLGGTPRAHVNVQVDSAGPEAGLYVTWEFGERQDYDLWAYFADGTGAASSHGFQPLIETRGTEVPLYGEPANTTSNHGGESTVSSESLVGIITPDCGGYTLDMANYLGTGGDFELKVWLGEGTIAPGVPE